MNRPSEQRPAPGRAPRSPARPASRPAPAPGRAIAAQAWDVTEHPVRLADDGEWVDSQTRPNAARPPARRALRPSRRSRRDRPC